MSIIPAEWRTVSLGDICTLNYGKALPETARQGGTTQVYGSNGIVGYHNSAITSGRTIIIGRKGSFGEINFSEHSCWPIDTAYFVDEASTKQDIRWLAYRLNALGLNQMNKAAAVPGLNREDAYRQQLLLPPLPEQRRIAAILDQADALRAKRREALALLDSLAQSIFIEMFGDPITNTKGWPIYSLVTVSDRIQIGPFGSQLHEEDYINDGIPLVNPTHIKGGRIYPDWSLTVPESKYRQLSQYHLSAGDLILGRRGEMGRCAVITSNEQGWLCGTGSLFIRLNAEVLNPIYLGFVIASDSMRRYLENVAQGVTMANLNKDIVGALPIPTPPIERQLEFVSQLSGTESLRNSNEKSLNELNLLFASLQHRAFRGEL